MGDLLFAFDIHIEDLILSRLVLRFLFNALAFWSPQSSSRSDPYTKWIAGTGFPPMTAKELAQGPSTPAITSAYLAAYSRDHWRRTNVTTHRQRVPSLDQRPVTAVARLCLTCVPSPGSRDFRATTLSHSPFSKGYLKNVEESS
jgi:hypothetical protein